MTHPRHLPTDHHVTDLLPVYLNGTLDSDTQARVRAHLDRCAACRNELAEWRAIANATRVFADTQSTLAMSEIDDSWGMIDSGEHDDPLNGGAAWRPPRRRGAARKGAGHTENSTDRFVDHADYSGRSPMPTFNTPALSPPTTRRGITLPSWTQHLHLVSTGLLIVAVIALAFAAFGPGGPGRGGNDTRDGPGFFGAVPGATIPEGAETSSIPYPTADECTVEQMTRVEVIEHLKAANYASGQFPWDSNRYEPADQEAGAIMQAFREWQACSLEGKGPLYRMQFQTPMYTSRVLPLFSQSDEPISDEVIEDWVGTHLIDEERALPEASEEAPATPIAFEATPAGRPILNGGTPVSDESGGWLNPTIFAEDIEMVSPAHAVATAYLVDPATQEVKVSTPITCWFEMNHDGQWLIHSYNDSSDAQG